MPPKGYKLSPQAIENVRQGTLRHGVEVRVDPKELYYLYWDMELSARRIAKIKNVTENTILNHLHRFGIRVRTEREANLLWCKTHPSPKGEKHPGYGKKASQETRNKLSAKRKGRKLSVAHSLAISKGTKEAWDKLTPKEKAERMLPSLRSMNKQPNNIETKLDSLLQENFPKEWKYVGNGEVVIGELIPDFININGKKQVIELFGNYWHNPETTTDWRRTELGRIMHYNCYGFKCFVIWENDLIQDSGKIVSAVEKFSKRGLRSGV